MKRALTALVPVLLAAACSAPSSAPETRRPGELLRWGTLREALRDGRDEGRVDLASVARPGVFGLGALEGLRGEVTVVDGTVWISEGSAERATTTREAGAARATVLFAAEVEAWDELRVEEDVDPSALDAYVARRAREAGLDTSRPFAFVIEGPLLRLEGHVLGGECPTRARRRGVELTQPPYALHEDRVDGLLVGIHAEGAAGVVCHAGSSAHVHAVLAARDLTCHADSVGLAAGSTLRLPRR